MMFAHNLPVLRMPQPADGLALHALIRSCPPLDLNSSYMYTLLCRDFATTTVLADDPAKGLVGAITAYLRPEQAQTLFVWQVAVAPAMRGKGLAQQMLDHLIERPVCADVAYVEATISPNNLASQSLFASFAKRHGVSRNVEDLFSSAMLGNHDPEELHQLGPFTTATALRA